MKKNILFMTMLAMAGFTLSSCSDKETEGTSRITTYAVLELNGDAYETVQLGSSYNDPGCTAKMGDEDVTDKIVTDGAVNTNKLGYYDLTMETPTAIADRMQYVVSLKPMLLRIKPLSLQPSNQSVTTL